MGTAEVAPALSALTDKAFELAELAAENAPELARQAASALYHATTAAAFLADALIHDPR